MSFLCLNIVYIKPEEQLVACIQLWKDTMLLTLFIPLKWMEESFCSDSLHQRVTNPTTTATLRHLDQQIFKTSYEPHILAATRFIIPFKSIVFWNQSLNRSLRATKHLTLISKLSHCELHSCFFAHTLRFSCFSSLFRNFKRHWWRNSSFQLL